MYFEVGWRGGDNFEKKNIEKKLIKSDSKKVALYASVSNENCQCCNTAHPC